MREATKSFEKVALYTAYPIAFTFNPGICR